MTANELLQQFEHMSRRELAELRRSARLDTLPRDQLTYLKIADEMFPAELTDDLLTDGAFDRRQRIVSVFREFLYHDGRTFLALMKVASRASDDQIIYNSCAVNALAGLNCYVVRPRRVFMPMTDTELIDQLQELCQIEDTSHNANRLTDFLRTRGDV